MVHLGYWRPGEPPTQRCGRHVHCHIALSLLTNPPFPQFSYIALRSRLDYIVRPRFPELILLPPRLGIFHRVTGSFMHRPLPRRVVYVVPVGSRLVWRGLCIFFRIFGVQFPR